MADGAPSRSRGPPSPASSPAGGVDAFLGARDPLRVTEIRALRRLIPEADPVIAEGIKWNAPSFRTPAGFFATFHLRAKDGVQLILHRGARTRDDAPPAIADPEGLLQWLGPDRATIRFRDLAEIEARRDAVSTVIRQ